MTASAGNERVLRFRRRALFASVLLALSVANESQISFAQEVEAPPVNAAEPENAADKRERQQRAMAGLAAVAGIAILGIALGTLIILWAGRLRRMTREPLPSSKLQNEFWFLRPPKPPVSERGPESPDDTSHQ